MISDIDKAFGSVHKSVTTKIKNYVSKAWIAGQSIVEHGVNIFEWEYKLKWKHKKMDIESNL